MIPSGLAFVVLTAVFLVWGIVAIVTVVFRLYFVLQDLSRLSGSKLKRKG